jgi:IS5 family transposase
LLLKETIQVALRGKHLQSRELKHVNVDTTVQEKKVAFPTDSRLLYRSICKLGKAAKNQGLRLRQSYVRCAKRACIMAGRYAHAKQFRRMRRQLRFLRCRLGRLIRDIERKASQPLGELSELLVLGKRLLQQKKHDRNKLYSLHEPEVRCISKGKAHKRYEFGCKVAVATSNRGNWFLASFALENNPYDGHTLARSIAAVERNTEVKVDHIYVDRGYRGHDFPEAEKVHITGRSKRRLTRTIRKRLRRRSAIEPKIGHAKLENRMGRCYLKGVRGDMINAIMAAAGSNFRKLLKFLRSLRNQLLNRSVFVPPVRLFYLCPL